MNVKERQALRALINLAAAWDELAPEKDRGFVATLTVEMAADGLDDKWKQCEAVVGRLYDGLAYGNWPSAIAAR